MPLNTDQVTRAASAKDVRRVVVRSVKVGSGAVKDEIDDWTLGARARLSQRRETKRSAAATSGSRRR